MSDNTVEAPTIAQAAERYAARDFAAAAEIGRALIAREPQHFDALHMLGVLALNERRFADAISYLRRAERERPDDAQLRLHIGNGLLGLQLFDAAADAYRRTLELAPDHFDALNNLGNALAGAQRHGEAIDIFVRALRVRAGAPQALYNLGRALAAVDRLEEATHAFRATINAAGANAPPDRLCDVFACLCDALARQARYADALAVCRAVPPSIADAPPIVWNRALALLTLGNYADGWRDYQQRFLVPAHGPPRAGASVLDVTALAGKHVLVVPEQGRGDMIQFARYLPLLAERGARVTVEMYSDLQPLFRNVAGVAEIIGADDDPPPYDALTPLLSLPLAFGTTLETVPAQVPYLRVPDDYAARWVQNLGSRKMPRIGIAWSGSSQSASRAAMPLPALDPLLRSPGLEFHVLQKEISAADLDWLRHHASVAEHGAALQDFADTAALIGQMDLVVSIDTSVAHLAGALGQQVWIMLPFDADWRWLVGREDSPWYPTARLFRQSARGVWTDVVQRVAAKLAGEALPA